MKLSLDKITGNTPLVKITDKIYGKLETYNPSGSVKDRMVTYVIKEAIRSGKIDEKTVLCEATSGNIGIALSMIAASLGLQCVIFMPGNMSRERKIMMTTYGAKIIDAPDDDFERAIQMRDEFISCGENVWSPNQFDNPENIMCHETTTGPEIQRQIFQLGLTWSSFVHGSGTGGTIEGVRRFLVNSPTKTYMVAPAESPHGIQGIGDGKDYLADPNMMDGVITIETDAAINRAKKFAKETGLLVGISAGANILASEIHVAENNPEGVVVTMLCDRGERYMSIY